MSKRTTPAMPMRAVLREIARNPKRVFVKAVQSLLRPLLSLGVVRPFTAKGRWLRECVFHAAHRSGRIDLVCVDNEHERMIASFRDNVIGRRIFVDGQFDFEKFELAIDLLHRHAKLNGKVDLLVDVGANIGSICIPSITRGHASRVLAIEPDPSNCRILRANVALNGLERSIDIRQLAVGAVENETLMLELSETNWGDHRISVSDSDGSYGERARQKIPILSTTLDSLIATEHAESRLIWMDTQGYEGRVLRGASQSILLNRTPMVVEFWPYGLTRAGGVEEFIEALSRYEGYFDLDHPHTFHAHAELEKLFVSLQSSGGFTDLLVF